jgi:hypothetical protein
MRSGVLLLGLGVALAGCFGSDGSPTEGAAAPHECPVTIPNGSVPPGERVAGNHHGDGKLWLVLPARGELVAVPPGAGSEDWVTTDVRADGSVGMKFGWTRGPGISGRLEVTGRRLDAPSAPLTAEIQDYGPTGFQPSTLVFPTEGCWEVTGRAGDAELTFVLRFVDEVTDHDARAPRAPADCPVTIPNGKAPADAATPLNHGAAGVWTSLPPRGIVVAVAPGHKLTPDSVTGAIARRRGATELPFWPWSRARARGPFKVSGRRLEVRSRPLGVKLRNASATDLSSRLTFPEAGCWRITGRSGAEKLTFVVYLVDRLRGYGPRR